MATTLQPITELEAINQMLGAISEAPISTLAVSGDLNVSVAIQMLYDVSREVQNVGYNFNTEDRYPISLTTDNELLVPSNALLSELADDFRDMSVTARGQRLYDKKNHTYIFDKSIKMNLVLFLAWELLPQPARQYITIKAARRFQRRMLGDDLVDGLTGQEEMESKAQLQDADATASQYNLGQARDMGTFLSRRR